MGFLDARVIIEASVVDIRTMSRKKGIMRDGGTGQQYTTIHCTRSPPRTQLSTWSRPRQLAAIEKVLTKMVCKVVHIADDNMKKVNNT